MAKKTRKISEYGGKEVYKSASAKRRHESRESPAMERRERASSKKKKR